MSLKDFLTRIKEIANNNTMVNFASIDDVYEIWQGGEIRYAAVNISLENLQYSEENNMQYLNIILYYGDRLMQNKANLLNIYTDSARTLQSIINLIFQLEDVGSVDDYIIEFFDQQFSDYLAGGYVRLRIGLVGEMDDCSGGQM